MTTAAEWKLKLPPGIDSPETRALLLVLERWDTLPVERVLVWHIDSTVEDALPHVAEMLGLDAIDFAAGPPRALLAKAVELLKAAGTPGAMKEVITLLGYDPSVRELQEETTLRYDGTARYDGTRNYGQDAHWSFFFVIIDLADDDELLGVPELRELWSAIDAWRPERSPYALVIRVAGLVRITYRAKPTFAVPYLAPHIDSVSDVSTLGGVAVVLGSDFRVGDIVQLAGNRPTTFISSTELHATLAAHASGTVAGLRVVRAGALNNISNTVSVEYVGITPTLTSLARTAKATSQAVLTTGGDSVTFTGSSLSAGAEIEIGTTPTVTLVSTTGSGTSLVAVMPVLAKGLYTVRVKNPGALYSATLNLRVVASPATKSLAHYISQGIGLDYAGGIRPEVPSAGLSGSSTTRRQQTDGLNLLPVNGPVIDGVTTVRYGGTTFNLADKSALRVAQVENFVITPLSWHFIWMGYISDTQGVDWLPTGGSPALASCAASAALQVGKVAGAMQVAVFEYDGSYKGQSIPCTGDAWHMVEARRDPVSGKIQVRADQGPWSSGVACGSHTSTGYPVQTGNYGANGFWCANADNVFFIADPAVSDADTADIYDYAKYYLVPSAGLP